MTQERLLQTLSAVIILVGGVVTRAHARESGGCTGVYWANLPANKTCEDYSDESAMKTFCDDYFSPPNPNCGRPGSVACGADGDNGLLMRCDYGY